MMSNYRLDTGHEIFTLAFTIRLCFLLYYSNIYDWQVVLLQHICYRGQSLQQHIQLWEALLQHIRLGGEGMSLAYMFKW